MEKKYKIAITETLQPLIDVQRTLVNISGELINAKDTDASRVLDIASRINSASVDLASLAGAEDK